MANNIIQQYRRLYSAVCRGDWGAANDFLNEYPEGITARIDELGSTALHIAAGLGHSHIVRELVELMPPEFLELENNEKVAPFFRAIDTGIVQMAEYMIRRNRDLVQIPNVHDLLPVTYAVIVGQLKMARHLYSISLEEHLLLPERGHHGATLLGECFKCGNLDLALNLLRRYPSLALTPNKGGTTFVWLLACKPSVFRSGCQLQFWQLWIYNWIQIDITESNASDDEINKGSCVERICQSKLTYEQSQELLSITCDQIATLVTDSQLREAFVFDSIMKAAENGIPEFIIGVINANPKLLYTWVDSGGTIFSNAVKFRQAKVFSLIYGLVTKTAFANNRDNSGNSQLHMTGMLEFSTQLNRISGAALQIQREFTMV